eukprot:scaffold127279_cov63-Phaeocystis_antarctica.AAC.1
MEVWQAWRRQAWRRQAWRRQAWRRQPWRAARWALRRTRRTWWVGVVFSCNMRLARRCVGPLQRNWTPAVGPLQRNWAVAAYVGVYLATPSEIALGGPGAIRGRVSSKSSACRCGKRSGRPCSRSSSASGPNRRGSPPRGRCCTRLC